jgi:hypothetical protein
VAITWRHCRLDGGESPSETERQSHYFQARVAGQFDTVVHIDDTRAVEPLERTAGWGEGEAPETYPFEV